MNREKILKTFQSLAQSQGFYGRLLEQIKDNEAALDFLEAQNFADELDLILFLES